MGFLISGVVILVVIGVLFFLFRNILAVITWGVCLVLGICLLMVVFLPLFGVDPPFGLPTVGELSSWVMDRSARAAERLLGLT